MNEWNIRKITKQIIEIYGVLTNTITFNRDGSLLRDILRDGKTKKVNYSKRTFLFWSYERQEHYDAECDRIRTIKIRNMKGRVLIELKLSNSELYRVIIYDKNGKNKFFWDDCYGDTDLIISKNGKEKYNFSKMPLVNPETDVHYDSIRNTFYNSLGNKTVVFEKNKYKNTKTVYIYNSNNQITKKLCTDLKTHKVIKESLYEYNKNNDLIYSCKKHENKLTNSISYSYNEKNQLVKSSEIDFDESQKPESQLDKIFSYDVRGRLIRETRYRDGSKTREETMEYDDSNNLIKKTEFWQNFNDKEFLYKYENNLCVEEEYISYESDGTIFVNYKYAYKYDENGNKIQEIMDYSSGERVITNFDKFGNIISSITYEDESEIILCDINGIAYMTCQNDKSHIVKTNSDGMPIEIYKAYIPGVMPWGAFKRTIIEYEYF